MSIRRATEADLDIIMEMVTHSRGLMRADGNMTQWTGYPTRDDLLEDIRCGVSYILCDNLATFALVPGIEPTYGYIDHGRWIDTDSPYATIHRLAKAPRPEANVSREVFAYAKQSHAYLRADTHAANRPMRHILQREGFVESGIVYMGDGSPRVAYEWWRWDEVPADLKAYVEEAILPRHEAYDAAHRPGHVRRVIARAMVMSAGRLPAMLVYVAAAMHDIGICEGREVHHLASGRIIRDDNNLRRWLTEAEIETVARAAEDHRASSKMPPRSLLGCIIAEADRDIEPENIVCRTVEYGLSHYPDLDREGHWRRTLDHLHEKYAEGGYIKLWLPDSPNVAPLAELRAIIADEQRLRILFDKCFER